MNGKALPAEIVASILAVTTVIISLPPFNLPPWAIFIGWAGTFAAGGPTRHVLQRIWPVMPLGSTTALLIVLGFQLASHYVSGTAFIIAQMVILFVLNTAQLYLARVPLFAFAPGMFFGFASYFATFYGGFGPVPHNPFWAWIAVVLMNALGPIYAYLNVRWSTPQTAAEVEGLTEGRI
jgi:hypothetical protein